MRISTQGKVNQIGQGGPAALSVDLASRSIPADDLGDLGVEQMRRVQRRSGIEQSAFYGGRG